MTVERLRSEMSGSELHAWMQHDRMTADEEKKAMREQERKARARR